MNCPHCHQPIPDALVIAERNKLAAGNKRPGAKGLVRNPKGRPRTQPEVVHTKGHIDCPACHRAGITLVTGA